MEFLFPEITADFYMAALPVLLLCVGSIIAMLQTVFKSISSPGAVYGFTVATLIAALIAALLPGSGEEYLGGAYLSDSLGTFGQVLILLISTVVALLYRGSFMCRSFYRGEIASLFLMVVAGMLVMVSSLDFITLFVGLELSSIGLYCLIGYVHPTQRSQEGAIKYFVLGSFAAAILLFGMGLLYAGTGTLHIRELLAALPAVSESPWVRIGGLFFLVGLAFKLALVPFHLWAPDAYEAAPTGITALMATSVKVMIVTVTLRLVVEGLRPDILGDVWGPVLIFTAGLSMVIGNIMALIQSSLKRMLAYSSIAHSGYIAVAICAIAGAREGYVPMEAILFYLISYSIISLGAFGVVMWLENDKVDNIQLEDLPGLGSKHPWAAFALAALMFAFAGMPPTIGFMSKFFVFNAALTNEMYGLVLVGALGSAISLYYYLNVIVKMYMAKPKAEAATFNPTPSKLVAGLVGAAVILSVAFGAAPEPLLSLVRPDANGGEVEPVE